MIGPLAFGVIYARYGCPRARSSTYTRAESAGPLAHSRACPIGRRSHFGHPLAESYSATGKPHSPVSADLLTQSCSKPLTCLSTSYFWGTVVPQKYDVLLLPSYRFVLVEELGPHCFDA